MKTISIGPYTVGDGHPPMVVAELSGNHNKSIQKALDIIDLAADAGAHAIKLQTYTADSITIDCSHAEFSVNDPNSLWHGRRLYSLYQEASTPYEWHEALFEKCRQRGILCFSTPFDENAVDFLEKFDPPCYKIASFENNHFPLIRKVIRTRKPLIISLGISSWEEILELDCFLKSEGAKDVILLKCTSAYPAHYKDANLLTLQKIRNDLDRLVGLSDHTNGVTVSIASVALGACIIEKHFTDSRAKGGVDAAFSLEPGELKRLVDEAKIAWECLGSVSFALSEGERSSLKHKRSIYLIKDIKKGDPFTKDNLGIIRPGFGMPPKYFESILGMSAADDISRGTALKQHHIDGYTVK